MRYTCREFCLQVASQAEVAEKLMLPSFLISTNDCVNSIPKTDDLGETRQATRCSPEDKFEGDFPLNQPLNDHLTVLGMTVPRPALLFKVSVTTFQACTRYHVKGLSSLEHPQQQTEPLHLPGSSPLA